VLRRGKIFLNVIKVVSSEGKASFCMCLYGTKLTKNVYPYVAMALFSTFYVLYKKKRKYVVNTNYSTVGSKIFFQFNIPGCKRRPWTMKTEILFFICQFFRLVTFLLSTSLFADLMGQTHKHVLGSFHFFQG
jgi:hypothetical protein